MNADPTTPIRSDGHLPLEDYGVISDGRTIALVGTDGSIDWWCVPAPDAPPVFDRLLDGHDGGRFSITPVEPFSVHREYREGSNVLETTFTTASGGQVRVTDSLNSGHAGRLPWSELARRVEGLAGEVELAVDVTLGTRFGASEPVDEVTPNGDAFQLGPLLMQLRTTKDCAIREPGEDTDDDDARAGGHDGAGGRAMRIRAHEGSRSTVALLATDGEPLMDSPIEAIDVRIDRSDAQWKHWSDDLTYDGPYAGRVIRSALALKLLLFSPTGAIAAAATTSLPERFGGGKNWDYRFAWVRDAAYSIKALLRTGGVEEAQAGFAWLMATIERHLPELSVFYTLTGELPPAAREDHLPGYRGFGPVMVGNDARQQRQLSCFGDVLEAAELFVRRGNHLDLRTRGILTGLADHCVEQWRKPDAGIWELHGDEHHTMSKIGCWLALDRAAALADRGVLDASRGAFWRAESETILAWIDEHCWDAGRATYTQYAGSTALDAALLLATRFGFPRVERLDATRVAVQAELATGALVHRYSGMQDEEGAFLATSFWLVEALAFLGHVEEAEAAMDELMAITSCDLGLMAEMVDVDTHAFLGNMPQGLSHLAMIHAALAIQEARDSPSP